ncbi:MAG TPA: hypothetical protein EYN67_15870 [Flavobacteriales bacterium]|nr:hypothetical protein [Flavobacteriales bacterium]
MAATKSITSRTIKEVQRALPRESAYRKGLKVTIERHVKKAQEKLLANFEQHPVTLEIGGGPGASNISGTLNGIGNLFSYIGFDSGDQPLNSIRSMLKQYEIKFHHTKTKTIINITVPTTTDIFKASPLPWATGRSWAKGIETGISGLGRYLNIESARSRSGKGVQTKRPVRAGKFNNTSYLSLLLKTYYKEIRRIEKGTLS